jgi:hypothetical protein
MQVLLHNARRDDQGLIHLSVSICNQPPRDYRATYEHHDKTVYCNVEYELFMALSNLAHRRFGNCVVYQHELMGFMRALCEGGQLPAMPFALGTSRFCTMRPSLPRILWNKLRNTLHRIAYTVRTSTQSRDVKGERSAKRT